MLLGVHPESPLHAFHALLSIGSAMGLGIASNPGSHANNGMDVDEGGFPIRGGLGLE